MSRLTVRLSEERHRALKQEAVRRRTSMRQIVEESLEFYGVKTTENASTLVTAARQRSGLAEEDAMAVAVGETRVERVTADCKHVLSSISMDSSWRDWTAALPSRGPKPM